MILVFIVGNNGTWVFSWEIPGFEKIAEALIMQVLTANVRYLPDVLKTLLQELERE